MHFGLTTYRVILKFNDQYELLYATYFGGSSDENIYEISFQSPTWDNKHNAVFVGYTKSPYNNFPLSDIPGNIDYYDGFAINYPGGPPGPRKLEGPQGFISNLYNVSTPLKVMYEFNAEYSINHDNCIKFWPNPFSHKITVQSNNETIQNLMVYDIQGKQIFCIFDINKTQITLDTHSWDSGVYIIEVTTNNEITSRSKIIKN